MASHDTPQITKALLGPDESTRAKAIEAILTSEDWEAGVYLELAAKSARGSEAAGRLIHSLLEVASGTSDARVSAVRALGELGDEEAMGLLVSTTNHDDPHMRRAAARVLGKLGNPAAVGHLHRLLDDSDAQVRSAAVDALGEASEDALDLMVALLDNPDAEVRRQAVIKLEKLGDSRAVEPLIGVLSDESSDVRGQAVRVLGVFGDKRAVEPLIAALNDSDWGIRRHAADALRLIGDRRAVEPLIETLGIERSRLTHAYVRFGAAEALGALGDMRAVEPLITALEDVDETVRAAAAEALLALGLDRSELLRRLEMKRMSKLEIIRDIEELGRTDFALKTALSPLATALASGQTINLAMYAATLAQLANSLEMTGTADTATIGKLRHIEEELKKL